MKTMVLLAALAIAPHLYAQEVSDSQSIGIKLDTQLFDAYNSCDLTAFGNLLAPEVEFYDDRDGLMIGRQPVADAVKKYICGKVRRELVDETLKSYPIQNYGIVQLGEHRFCTVGTDKCNGVSRFVHLWQKTDGVWRATRIISYDHKPL